MDTVVITRIWVKVDEGMFVVEEDDGDGALWMLNRAGDVEDLDYFEDEDDVFEQVYPPEVKVFGWSAALDAAMDRVQADALYAMAKKIGQRFGVASHREIVELINDEARRHVDAIDGKFAQAIRGWITEREDQ
jgi:hypothetical protein